MEQQKNKLTEFFRNFTHNFSIVTILSLGIAYLYMFMYYDEFKIDVLSYFTLTELFFAFLPFTFFVACSGIFVLHLHEFLYFLQTEEADKLPFFKNKRRVRIVLLLLILCSLSLPILVGYNIKVKVIIFLIVSIACYNLFLREMLFDFVNNGFTTPREFFLLAILVAAFSLGLGAYNGLMVKKFGLGTNYIIKLHNSEVIRTNKQNFVIGETQSSLFLYNKKDSTTRVLKRDLIDSLIIK